MVVTGDDELAERLRLLRSHGMTTLTWDRHRGHASGYDVVSPGFNYRLDELRAALGLVQLRRLAERNDARRAHVRALPRPRWTASTAPSSRSTRGARGRRTTSPWSFSPRASTARRSAPRSPTSGSRRASTTRRSTASRPIRRAPRARAAEDGRRRRPHPDAAALPAHDATEQVDRSSRRLLRALKERARGTPINAVTNALERLVTGGAGLCRLGARARSCSRAARRVRVLDSLLHGSVPSLLGAWGDERFEFVARRRVRPEAVARGASTASTRSSISQRSSAIPRARASRTPRGRSTSTRPTRLLDARRGGRRPSASCSPRPAATTGSSPTATRSRPRSGSCARCRSTPRRRSRQSSRCSRAPDDGFATACLRLATVYGASPRMRFDLTVNEFTRDVALDGDLVVYGEQFWRPYVHVRDAARGVRSRARRALGVVAGEVFNVGATDENYRKLDLVELLRERFPTPSRVRAHATRTRATTASASRRSRPRSAMPPTARSCPTESTR